MPNATVNGVCLYYELARQGETVTFLHASRLRTIADRRQPGVARWCSGDSRPSWQTIAAGGGWVSRHLVTDVRTSSTGSTRSRL